MNYLQLRQKTSQQTNEEELQYDLEDNKSQLELDLRETKRAIVQAQRELEKLKSQKRLLYNN